MARVFNFSAGPAALPEEVLRQAKAELTDWQNSGMSVMEVSHRSKAFEAVADKAESDIRELMGINSNYDVLFLQGGATQQFALLPMNLAGLNQSADYLITGSWSNKAVNEARALRNINVVADGKSLNYLDVPNQDDWQLSASPTYFHYCANETIGGLEIHEPIQVGDTPIVVDMSSTILSRPIDVNRFGVIYAGAQKNIGPAGLTILIVRKDLLSESRDGLPNILNYSSHAASGSMLNTPPTFSWYMAGLVFSWIKDQGGLKRMGELNQAKAEKLYSAIDNSEFYSNPVQLKYRSWMNIPFTLAEPELDNMFLKEAAKENLMNLKGHRSVGGMRASIYNAVPMSAVDALIDFMHKFEKNNG
ncbi:MAG: 3-phosphoserine/phosphohydroxythreonine transaminase [Pseudomonadota bacterium]|nr:3-phosphoserine/phosphohydroxythreonine transaminase [Pseudomonadota bacterium]